MTKRIIIIISVVIVFIFLVLFIQAALKPKPFNWFPSYSSYIKQPYGASIIFKELKNLFPGKKVKRFGKDDFVDYYWYVEDGLEYYDDELETDIDSTLIMYKDGEVINYSSSEEAQTMESLDSSLVLYDLEFDSIWHHWFNVVLIDDFFYADDLNTRALLLHAYQGNEAFIAANEFDENLMDYLGIETAEDSIEISDSITYTDEFVISVHEHLPVQLRSRNQYWHITSYPDSARVIATNKPGQVLGVKVKVGQGSVTLFTLPILFTNYYMLKDDNSVAENLLLALPHQDTYWGNRIIGRQQYPDKASLLSFIHSQESLSWAFYTIIISVLLLLLFQMKRKQRIIPVVSKPENESLRFVEVISNLYLLNKNNKALLKKKMTYFLEMIRSRYHLNTSIIDEPFFNQLATKSKVDIRIIKKIFRDYDILENQTQLHNAEFLHFNKLIQHFKHKR